MSTSREKWRLNMPENQLLTIDTSEKHFEADIEKAFFG
jgi:hypothetical protein